jgi:putative transposase
VVCCDPTIVCFFLPDIREQSGASLGTTIDWTAQQKVKCCAWDRWPPRFLIHDRDGRYGVRFNCRIRHRRIKQVRTPLRAPRANSIPERWVKIGADGVC